jgi:hypothetical protein
MPKSRKRPKKKAKDQHAQFVETARRLGADMDEETFRRTLSEIAKAKPDSKRGKNK